jgi:hypothetical protein
MSFGSSGEEVAGYEVSGFGRRLAFLRGDVADEHATTGSARLSYKCLMLSFICGTGAIVDVIHASWASGTALAEISVVNSITSAIAVYVCRFMR